MAEVALVYMPWASAKATSIALGLLKSVLQNENISSDVYYLNVRLAKLMDITMYEEICASSLYEGEWLFSQFLFNEAQVRDRKTNYLDLIQPALEFDHYLYLSLKKHKDLIQPLIYDIIPRFIDDCLNQIDWSNYKVVGFTCMIGYQLPVLLISKKIKERFPHLKIVFGGPNVREKMGEEILTSFDWVDYVIDGEAETAFPDLVKNIMKGNLAVDIPSVVYKNNGVLVRGPGLQTAVPLDLLPTPDYAEYYREIDNPKLKAVLPFVRTVFESSRGCWWGEKCQCSFCGLSNGYLNYRSKSAEKVIAELREQSTRYNNSRFFASDLNFSLGFFDNLLPELASGPSKYDFFYEVKANLRREQVYMLHAAGIRLVQAGIESLNTKLLKLLRKGVSAIQNIQFLKFCREVGVAVEWNFLYRIPNEEQECFKEIIKAIPSIVHLQPPRAKLIPIALDRGSPYFTEPEKYGIKDITPKGLFQLIYPDSRINLDNIAYSFDFSFEHADETVLSYFDEMAFSIATWQKFFTEGKCYCQYKINGDRVEIEDNRPVSMDQETNTPQMKRYVLEGLAKDVFLLCDEITSLEEIHQQLTQPENINLEKAQLAEILSKFKSDRLLYEENGRYVNLTIRR